MKKSQIVFFLLIIFTILIIVHLVIYEGTILVFPGLSTKVLRILVPILPIIFIGANVLSFWANNLLTRILYRLVAVWIGSTLYLFLASIVLGFANFVPGINLIMIGQILFIAALLTSLYGVIHAQQIKITHTTIKLAYLPAAWQKQKLVFVSDLHLGQIRGEKFAARIAKKINELKPQIVLIGGDLYDGVKVDSFGIIEPLKNISTPFGTYFITGNHDGFTDKGTKEDVSAIGQAGVKVLQDAQVQIEGLNFIGADYKHTVGRENFAKILQQLNIDPTKPNILIKHVPDNIDVAARAGIALQLSGHTHRAQTWPLRYLPRMIYKGFDYGLKKSGAMQVFTSSGVGTWGPPLRVGTNSEIVLITLESA